MVDAPPPDVRHAETVARLRAGGDDLDLPSRLSLFGHTRLPETEVSLLTALGELRDVHLWLPQASTVLWDALAPAAREGQVPRAADTSAGLVGHPLLGSLGRDARELRRTLGDLPSSRERIPQPAPRHAARLAPARPPRQPRADPGRAVRRAPSRDDSVQVHACHGAARQVDVLREVLVGLLEDDPHARAARHPRDGAPTSRPTRR